MRVSDGYNLELIWLHITSSMSHFLPIGHFNQSSANQFAYSMQQEFFPQSNVLICLKLSNLVVATHVNCFSDNKSYRQDQINVFIPTAGT